MAKRREIGADNYSESNTESITRVAENSNSEESDIDISDDDDLDFDQYVASTWIK